LVAPTGLCGKSKIRKKKIPSPRRGEAEDVLTTVFPQEGVMLEN